MIHEPFFSVKFKRVFRKNRENTVTNHKQEKKVQKNMKIGYHKGKENIDIHQFQPPPSKKFAKSAALSFDKFVTKEGVYSCQHLK